MRNLLIVAAAGLAIAPAALARSGMTLYNNGPVTTGVNSVGNPISVLTTPDSTLGFGHQAIATINNRVADDFTVTDAAGWNIDSICFFSYQTGASGPTHTNVKLDVWSGRPGDMGSFIVMSYAGLNSQTFESYRVTATTLTNTTRPIFANEILTPGLSLGAGTYWLSWQTDGTLASGPWAPPVTFDMQSGANGNARQFIGGTTNVWQDAIDTGSAGQKDFPFIVKGKVVPTPGALALLGLGGLAAARRRRA